MYQHNWETKRHSIAWKLWRLWKVMRLWNKLLWLLVISLLNWALCGHGRITSPAKIFEVNYLWSAISNRKKVILSEVSRKNKYFKVFANWLTIHSCKFTPYLNQPSVFHLSPIEMKKRSLNLWLEFCGEKRKIPSPEQYYQGL